MDKERKRELSARIKAHRKYRGLTQEIISGTIVLSIVPGPLYDIEKQKERMKMKKKTVSLLLAYRGLTQEQAAEQVGITYSSYVKIENAFQTPSLSTLVKISEVLDVSLDWLVFGRG